MIGILGGTFDPVHHGHLRMAIEAYRQYKLSEIIFIPCRLPVHKHTPAADAFHRCKMLDIALAPYSYFRSDHCEVDRETASYMLTSLKSLIARFPNEKFALLIGSDLTDGFNQWHGAEEIRRLAELIIMPRRLAISSSKIRNLIKSHKNANCLLPERVLDYILKQHLYITEKESSCQF